MLPADWGGMREQRGVRCLADGAKMLDGIGDIGGASGDHVV